MNVCIISVEQGWDSSAPAYGSSNFYFKLCFIKCSLVQTMYTFIYDYNMWTKIKATQSSNGCFSDGWVVLETV